MAERSKVPTFWRKNVKFYPKSRVRSPLPAKKWYIGSKNDFFFKSRFGVLSSQWFQIYKYLFYTFHFVWAFQGGHSGYSSLVICFWRTEIVLCCINYEGQNELKAASILEVIEWGHTKKCKKLIVVGPAIRILLRIIYIQQRPDPHSADSYIAEFAIVRLMNYSRDSHSAVQKFAQCGISREIDQNSKF